MLLTEQGLRVRPASPDDAPGISRVHVSSWLSAYRGIVAGSFLDALDPVAREPRWRDSLAQAATEGRMVFVAEFGPALAAMKWEIVGFASGGPEREGLVAGGVAYDGEIYALYLAPEHQRRGTGRRLVAASAGWLIDHGAQSIVIWALKENKPARAFYERLGGRPVGEKTVTIGPSDLIDVAYGWPDAQVLLDRAQREGTEPAEV